MLCQVLQNYMSGHFLASNSMWAYKIFSTCTVLQSLFICLSATPYCVTTRDRTVKLWRQRRRFIKAYFLGACLSDSYTVFVQLKVYCTSEWRHQSMKHQLSLYHHDLIQLQDTRLHVPHNPTSQVSHAPLSCHINTSQRFTSFHQIPSCLHLFFAQLWPDSLQVSSYT